MINTVSYDNIADRLTPQASVKDSFVNEIEKEERFEDDDAIIYKRAKQSVDELHRARKFEKSIKLR